MASEIHFSHKILKDLQIFSVSVSDGATDLSYQISLTVCHQVFFGSRQ